jgi:hypothetical protein
MNKAFKVAGSVACFVAVVAMCGGHWFALQSVAWGRMFADFSRQESIGMAIAKTFSGKYPCSMCLKIRNGWHQEKQPKDKLPWFETERMPEVVWQWRCVTAPRAPLTLRNDEPFVPTLHADFIDSPSTPPPRISKHVL